MKPVEIRDGIYYIEDVPLEEIREKFGTPLIIYSRRQLEENINKFETAFSKFEDHQFHYATKANFNPTILKIIKENGGGLDAANPNEAHLGLILGFDKSNITVSPNNLRGDELDKLIEEGFTINFDDENQFFSVKKIPEIFSIRINPGIGKGEFKGIVTGGKNSKFGTTYEKALKAYENAKTLGIKRFGIHMHTGSNILDPDFFSESSRIFFSIAERISMRLGIEFEYLDIGGGYGVPYSREEKELDIFKVSENIYRNFQLSEFQKIKGSRIITEPGRYIVANTAIILSSITNVKRTDKNFIGIDLSFNVLLRPALYGARHEIEIPGRSSESGKRYIVTGQACENTDRLGKNVILKNPKIGDSLIIYNAGAYVMSMASNYNLLSRPAEIMVDGSNIMKIRIADDLDSMLERYTF